MGDLNEKLTADGRKLEYERRVERIRALMSEERIGALLLTSEDNFTYVTGFDSPTWLNPARPRYCVVPQSGDPIIIAPTSNRVAIRSTSWISDVRTWVSPNPEDDGVSLVADALKSCAGANCVVGAELGPQSRLSMPIGDFLRLREQIRPLQVVDGDALVRRVRLIKSDFEIRVIGGLASAASQAFEQLAGAIHAGVAEVDAARAFGGLLLQAGVDQFPYMVAESGPHGYPSLQRSPSTRILCAEDIFGLDVGCRRLGYFCDLNRNFAIGAVSKRLLAISETLCRAMEAGVNAAVAGATASDVWRAQAAVIDGARSLDVRRAATGRMGHGVGLRLTESPSIHPEDHTVLAPGMVLAIEPAVEYVHAWDGESARILVSEENVVVTKEGPQLLSRRGPRDFFYVAT